MEMIKSCGTLGQSSKHLRVPFFFYNSLFTVHVSCVCDTSNVTEAWKVGVSAGGLQHLWIKLKDQIRIKALMEFAQKGFTANGQWLLSGSSGG